MYHICIYVIRERFVLFCLSDPSVLFCQIVEGLRCGALRCDSVSLFCAKSAVFLCPALAVPHSFQRLACYLRYYDRASETFSHPVCVSRVLYVCMLFYTLRCCIHRTLSCCRICWREYLSKIRRRWRQWRPVFTESGKRTRRLSTSSPTPCTRCVTLRSKAVNTYLGRRQLRRAPFIVGGGD